MICNKKFEDTKRLSKVVNRRAENTTATRKKPNNDLQNTTEKIKDWATQTPVQTGTELYAGQAVPAQLASCSVGYELWNIN